MVFRHALGDGFDDLPPALRAFHAPGRLCVWHGAADIVPAASLPAAAVARLFGFPRPGTGVPLTVTVHPARDPQGPSEVWVRDYDGRRMVSTLRFRNGVLTEAFGPLVFPLDVRTDARGLVLLGHGWRLGRVMLPSALAPRSQAREHQDEHGRFRFEVEITVPLLGLLVAYSGWLEQRDSVANG